MGVSDLSKTACVTMPGADKRRSASERIGHCFMDEEYRHQCEVRFILALRVKDERKAKAYLELVGSEKVRGEAARVRLNNDCIEQWKRGNVGMKGDWR